MKKTLFILSVMILTAISGTTACNFRTETLQNLEKNPPADTLKAMQVDSIIEHLFYNLPLEKSRLDLREVIVNDDRFVMTDSTFNDFEPSSFFKGITTDKGAIQSNPDSIQVMLIYGDAALITEKGGQEDFKKHPVILDCKYFFSSKANAQMEYARILDLVYPVFTDTTAIKDDTWEIEYSKGTEKCTGKILDHFDPYYRVAVAFISLTPIDGSAPVFMLDLAFSKEDKIRSR
jgi:hypothetical protein